MNMINSSLSASPMVASSPRHVAVIGGGPAGLMAAEVLSAGGARVEVYDAMPSVGRKFLLAGKGGLNITHSEALDAFLARYGARRTEIATMLEAFGPQALREWVQGLGVETFVGSSGRVFPVEKKAAPLLRAWLHRLREAGVKFHVRHRWIGGLGPREGLCFATPQGEQTVRADAVVLALGGGSWPQLGSDGAWTQRLQDAEVNVAPLVPANCGFDVNEGNNCGWSEHFRSRYAGHPVKPVVASFANQQRQGEFIITETGIEGSLIYALSSVLRDEIAANGFATLHLDLAPGRSLSRLSDELSRPRGARSLATHLKSQTGIAGVKAGLLREMLTPQDFADPARLAAAIKALPLRLVAPRPLAEAISSAGGVMFEALDQGLMLRTHPGVFCAGEMLDWEAPTGGYLLTACFASGRAAGLGALVWLNDKLKEK